MTLTTEPHQVLFGWYRSHNYAAAFAYAQTLVPDELPIECLNLAGVCAKRCGEYGAAEAYYRLAIDRDADCTAARNNLAILLQESGRSEEALTHYHEALQRTPNDPLPHLNLGNLYLASKQHEKADEQYRAALALNPELQEAMRYRAEALVALGQPGEAEALLNRALERTPNDVDALLRLATLASDGQRTERALGCCRKALAAQPQRADQLTRLAGLLHALKQPQLAEAAYRQSLALEPDNPNTLNDLGILMQETGRFADSETCYRRALTLRPENAEGWNNFAVLLQKQKRFGEAEQAYRKAISHRPDYAAARCNYGLLCLTLGRFEEGWPLYEARYAPDRSVPYPTLSKPQWQGEPLAGKSILVWNEQGMGDEIQFARFAKTLKSLGAKRVGFVCKRPLVSLMKSLEGADALHAEGEKFSIRPYDYWTFPLSIPRYCCPTPAHIPQAFSYLHPDRMLMQHWAPRLAVKGRKVGLVWKGRAEYSNDPNRSVPSLHLLAPLWSVPGITIFSLQKGEAEDEASHPPDNQPLVALGPDLRDFADTAAIVAQLDLVICVDTAIAHLCGALGVPCWVLLPYVGTDWRWMLERTDSPWYPSLRLFRQPAPGDWTSVVSALSTALRRVFDPAAAELWPRLRSLPGEQQALCASLIDLLAQIEPPNCAGGHAFAHWARLAHLLHQAAHPKAAKAAYAKALAINDKARGVLHNFGALCRAENDFATALHAYQRALEVDGPYPEGYYNLGNLHEAQREYPQAEACYRQAIALRPDYLEAWYNLGVALKHQGKLPESERALREAIALRGDYSEAHNNLGMVLQAQGGASVSQAEQAFRRAIEISPVAAEAHNNLGVLLQLQHRFDDAAREFELALGIRPEFPNAKWNLSLMHLMRGDFDSAWPLFAARTKITHPQSHPPGLPFPEWQGEDLTGKRILVWPEQGFGDEIQFCRYAPLLKQRGASRVTLACKPGLQRLFRTLQGADACIELAEGKLNIPQHDYWVFSMSLPAIFRSRPDDLPAALPYLFAAQEDIERWRAVMPQGPGKRVGLVWRGRATHPNDANRSLPGMDLLAPLFDLPGFRFISLQAEDATSGHAYDMTMIGHQFRDFADTAGAIAQLDLVISADTATAHLAAALGKPTWVLLPFCGLDWRWLAQGRHSPWYPGIMQLFRQEAGEDWRPVIARVRDALENPSCPSHPEGF